MDYDQAYTATLCFTANLLSILPLGIVLLIPFIIAALLFASATVSGAEVAFFSLDQQDFELLETDYPTQSTIVKRLLEHPRHLLATLLICNSFINIATIIITTYIINLYIDIDKYHFIGFLVEATVITFILVVFAEVVPKIYANRYNIRFVKRTARLVSTLERIFYPLAHLMVSSTKFIGSNAGQQGYKVSMEEIDHAIDLATQEKSTAQEITMLKDIVKFSHISVKQVMKPRMDIVAVDAETRFDVLLKSVIESGYSRYPVYHDSLDNITGMLYTKDLLPHLKSDRSFRWQQLVHKAFFVPETRKINDLLHDFQSRMIHMAIVMDEFGGTSGLMTLEDVMEEIIGDISDEFDDRTETQFTQTSKGTYMFEGKTLIHDACRLLSIPTDTFDEIQGESDSIAGLVLELSGKMPNAKDEFTWENYLFTVVQVDNNAIKKVQLTIVPPKQTDDDDEN